VTSEGRVRSADEEGRPCVQSTFVGHEPIVAPSLRVPAHAAVEDYVPFPVLAHRDLWQASLEIPFIIHCLGIPPAQRILEVGCGRANALVPLAERCAPRRLVGLDVDGGLLAGAQRHLEASGVAAELFQADVRSLPFPDRAFDVVLDFGTCYHIATPERALAEIARVLAPGGRLIHETPLAQLLAHPVRSSRRLLPWAAVPRLVFHRNALLFASRVKS
jgi:ubiquinone/menaquinone biosynthesis C-methylase UbiE